MKNINSLSRTLFNKLFLAVFGLCLLGSSIDSRAADYYWVNGSGNWSDYAGHWATTSGGTIFHTTIPTLNDNVYFDAASFSASGQVVLIDNTFIYCNNMDFTGSLFNPSVNGLGNTLHIYGSLVLIPNMSWSVKRVDFKGNNPGNTLSQAGNLLDTLYFDGPGTFSFTEDVVAKSIYVYDGTLSTAGFDVTVQRFVFGETGLTVAGDLSNSTINISNEFKAFYGTINLTSATCDLNFINNVVPKMYLWSQGHTFNNIYIQSNTEVIGGLTCQDLTADGTFYVNSNWTTLTCADATFSGNTTLDCIFNANSIDLSATNVFLKIRQANVAGTFTANGVCGQPIVIRPIDFLNTGTLTIPSGTVTVEYATITSIIAAGGASFIANNSVDGGNNTGWTINSAAVRTLYWIGGSGNWDDENHWSLTSGGAGGNCIPAFIDDVYFDANSFSQAGESVTLSNTPATCKNMSWAGVQFNPAINGGGLGSVILYGSIVLSPGMVWNLYQMTFAGSATGNTIFTAGVNIPGISIDGSGSWTLADELYCDGMSVYEGTFNSGNYDIHAGGFSANGNNAAIFVDFGTSTLYLGGSYIAFSSQLTINSSNANVIMENTTGQPLEFQSFNAQFNNVTFIDNVYAGRITCNRFDAYAGVVLTDLTALTAEFRASFQAYNITADSLIFGPGVSEFLFDSTQVNTAFTIASSCDNTLRLNKYNPFSSQAVLISPLNLSLDYLVLTNIQAIGGGTFTANNSWDMGNNSGWTVNMAASRDLYWVGGTGTWNDVTNWSLTSGGAGGECQPAMQDNVIFDANSFSQPGDTVYVHPTLGVYVNNLTFTNLPNTTLLYSSSGNSAVNVGGSLTMPAELDLYSVAVTMNSSNIGNTLTTGGNTLIQISFTGSGDWSLQDNLTSSNFSAGNGTFMSNGHDLNLGGVNVGGNATLDFGTSTITVLGFWSGVNVTVLGDDAHLIMTSSFLSVALANAHFGTITFNGTANVDNGFSCDYLYAMGDFTNIDAPLTAGYAEFKSHVTLPYSFVCDSLILDNPGKLVQLSNVTVNDYMVANGNSSFPVQIEGINGSGTLQKSSGQVCLDNVLIKDIIATGGAQFFAGANGVDLGGNTGWIFAPCIPLVTDVWPGDANYDLVADNDDILNIGLAYGYTGPVRAGASLAWVAQPATDWSAQFANSANLKHADTDGNGVVNADDTTAVSLNYGLFHAPRLSNPVTSQLPSPVLYLVANPDTAYLSDTCEIDIFLGTSALPVDSIYGIAFTVNIDTSLVASNYLDVDYAGCWLGDPQVDLIAFHKDLMAEGKIDMALVRNDQQNLSGFGFLARLGIVIVDNVGAKVTMPIVLTDIKAITASEYQLLINTEIDSIVIDTAASVGINELVEIENSISVYPNPANEQLFVRSGVADITGYEIYNHIGMLVATSENQGSAIRIATTSFSQGFYYLAIKTEKGLIYKKFEVIRK